MKFNKVDISRMFGLIFIFNVIGSRMFFFFILMLFFIWKVLLVKMIFYCGFFFDFFFVSKRIDGVVFFLLF